MENTLIDALFYMGSLHFAWLDSSKTPKMDHLDFHVQYVLMLWLHWFIWSLFPV